MNKISFFTSVVFAIGFSNTSVFAQNYRPITTAVPFLTITPDARSGAMGDVGVAISADANSSFWNMGKVATIEKKYGVSLSFTPWLAKLVNDMNISYLSGFYKPTKEQAFTFSMKYFNLGELQETDIGGFEQRKLRPKEYLFALGYSRKLSEKLSVGVAGKFIYSNLGGSFNLANSTPSKNGVSGAVDIGVYYKTDISIGAGNNTLALGATITDLGSKLSYSDAKSANPIPTAIKLGTAFTTEIDPYNKMTFAFDAFKLMVPSPPEYSTAVDSSGNVKSYFISAGKDPSKSALFSGMFGSFSDAPGGFKEEMQEIIWAGAVEYWYNDLFAARGGYFHESKFKGNRQYMTFGFGLKYQNFGLDFAYLVPVGNRNSPLAETLRFSLHYMFEPKQAEETIID